mgnify:CR=1 FL=1
MIRYFHVIHVKISLPKFITNVICDGFRKPAAKGAAFCFPIPLCPKKEPPADAMDSDGFQVRVQEQQLFHSVLTEEDLDLGIFAGADNGFNNTASEFLMHDQLSRLQ